MMNSTGRKTITSLAIACLFLIPMQTLTAQSPMPAILDSASLESQLDYLQERTRIYNGFRAVRDDIFLKMHGNALDSLNKEKL
ncbi:MAG: hypothetical protein KAT15_13875, partial [Bacteroidales bacterium]|nr:hypothetical protein [Bacteroidales bacterium]